MYCKKLKKIDVIANQILVNILKDSRQLKAIASEEMEQIITCNKNAAWKIYQLLIVPSVFLWIGICNIDGQQEIFISTKSKMLAKMLYSPEFVVALNQIGGGTPSALTQFGTQQKQSHLHRRCLHTMRARIISSTAFYSQRLVAASLLKIR
jgi:hypothetical protein